MQATNVRTGAADHPTTQLKHQAGFLGDRNEGGWRGMFPVRTVPADQRFGANALAGPVVLALVVKLELFRRLERELQFLFELPAQLKPRRQATVVIHGTVESREFGLIHRGIRTPEDLLGTALAFGEHCDANRWRDMQPMLAGLQGIGEARTNGCEQSVHA